MQSQRHRDRRRSGVSTGEALIAVTLLLGLLIALHPGYVRIVHAGRRAEALRGLQAIERAQSEQLAREGRYSGSLAQLGLALPGGHLRGDGSDLGPHYVFTLSSWQQDGRSHYRATAVAELDGGDATLDIVSLGTDVEGGASAERLVVLSDDVEERTRAMSAASAQAGAR